MKYVIKIVDDMGKGLNPKSLDSYLVSFDFEYDNGRGRAITSTYLADALRFNDVRDAWAFIHTSPRCRPMRDDSRPNRPLTATSNQIIPVVETLNGEWIEHGSRGKGRGSLRKVEND